MDAGQPMWAGSAFSAHRGSSGTLKFTLCLQDHTENPTPTRASADVNPMSVPTNPPPPRHTHELLGKGGKTDIGAFMLHE